MPKVTQPREKKKKKGRRRKEGREGGRKVQDDYFLRDAASIENIQ